MSLLRLASAGAVLGMVGSGVLMTAGVRAHVAPRSLDRGDGLPEAAHRRLGSLDLAMPVDGVNRAALSDSFDDPRPGGRWHHALDVMAPASTPVRAADAGTVMRLAAGAAGGLGLYLRDLTGQYCFYYAHLAGYAPGMGPGRRVERGDLLGYVGSTGNASPRSPHLHFAVFRGNGRAATCEGTPLNPYALLR